MSIFVGFYLDGAALTRMSVTLATGAIFVLHLCAPGLRELFQIFRSGWRCFFAEITGRVGPFCKMSLCATNFFSAGRMFVVRLVADHFFRIQELRDVHFQTTAYSYPRILVAVLFLLTKGTKAHEILNMAYGFCSTINAW